jgi:DNA-3-methyladenine glycosylase I
MNTNRCKWATNDPLYIEYHDNEWGIPKYDCRFKHEMQQPFFFV